MEALKKRKKKKRGGGGVAAPPPVPQDYNMLKPINIKANEAGAKDVLYKGTYYSASIARERDRQSCNIRLK